MCEAAESEPYWAVATFIDGEPATICLSLLDMFEFLLDLGGVAMAYLEMREKSQETWVDHVPIMVGPLDGGGSTQD